MLDSHKDNPNELVHWIESLDSRERAIYQIGYITAIHRLTEQLSDSKRKIATRLMDDDIDEKGELILNSRLAILDKYEDHYVRLIENLERKRELQP